MKPVLHKLIQRLGGWRAGHSCSGASVSQEKSGCGRRRQAEVGRRGLEREVAACCADRRRKARAISLRAVGRDGNALCGRRAAGRRARAGVADEHIGHAVRIAVHQIHRGRKEGHVAPVRADRGGNAVAIGGVVVQADGSDRHRGHASRGRARARVPHKYILRRSRNFRHAVRRGQHNYSVALVRAHCRRG